MDLAFIARLIDLVERSSLAELELSQGSERLRLVKGEAAVPAEANAGTGSPPVSQAQPSIPAAVPRTAGLHEIKAGFPGTFYRSPAPGEKPFVAVGDRVADGQQLGILEAMKTMNPLEADRAGVIRAILLDDASPVEVGVVLFVLEPDA